MSNQDVFSFYNRKFPSHRLTGQFLARYEVSHADTLLDFEPELDAGDAFDRWAKKVLENNSSGLVKLDWLVEMPEQDFKPEFFPGQYEQEGSDFLTYFSNPINEQTGQLLDWGTVPVKKLRWNKKQKDAGGFIEEATGWKPSLLQSHIDVYFLMEKKESMLLSMI